MDNTVSHKKLGVNFFYNGILRVLNIIFPIITFPYLARIFSPAGLGKIDFSISFVFYFVLFASLGIPTYGVRAIANAKAKKEDLSTTTSEIMAINLLFAMLSVVVFIFIVSFIDVLASYQSLMLILSITIITPAIMVEWFYQGTENYQYIAIRSVIVKTLSIIAIFIFVKTVDGLWIYALILSLGAIVNSLYNIIHLRTYTKLSFFGQKLNLKRHMKPILVLFALSLSTSIYLNLDKVMLGFIQGDTSVGIYTAGNKIIRIVITLITSLGIVLLPRMSHLFEEKKLDEMKRIIHVSFDLVLMATMPVAAGLFILSPEIIHYFAGSEYGASVNVMRILSPLVIVIGLSNLIGVQVLVAINKEIKTVIATTMGAITNIFLNLILIFKYSYIGVAISTVTAEFIVLGFVIYFAQTQLKNTMKWKNFITYLGSSLLMIVVAYLFRITVIIDSMILLMGILVIVSVGIYLVSLILTRNEHVVFVLDLIKRRSKHEEV